MRVLVIRPEMQALRTARKIAELGHDAVVFPLFRPLQDLEACRAALMTAHSALAVSSAEAVRCLQQLGTELAPHRSTPIFCVGRSTGRVAEEAGFTNVISGKGTGRDLAGVVAGHFAATGQPGGSVLYLAGRKRGGQFEATLAEHGIACNTVEIYDMQPVTYSIEEQQALLVNKPVDAAFFFSRENAKAFFGLDVFVQSKEALRKTLFFCLSRNIAEVVPEGMRNSAVVSLNPDEDELIDLL